MNNKSLWGPQEILDNQCYIWKLEHLWFWVKKRADEWFILQDREQTAPGGIYLPPYSHPILDSHGQDEDFHGTEQSASNTQKVYGHPTETPSIEGWSRFVTIQQDELEILPALPDRPLVVRPFMRVSLLPGRWANFFVAVPAWISLSAQKVKNHTIFEEFPTQLLSNTWFGDTVSGELCYALHTPLLREEPGETFPDYHIMIPLIIRNQSSETLQFQRLCIHVENLEIFHTAKGLMTNQVNVVFRGEESTGQIEVQRKPHKDAIKPLLIRPPRERMSKSVMRKTFDRFKEITGI